MAEEIQQAVQIVRVAYDGIEIAMKIGSGTISQMQKALDFVIALLNREKTMGKESMRKLLMKGGDLQVFQFATEDMAKVEKLAKKYGILYSVLPDINKADGKSEIIFHTEAVPRVNMMIQKLKSGRIATFDDYLKNGDEKEMDNILSFLKEQKNGKRGSVLPRHLHTAEASKANEALDGLIEKVGIYAMEKPSISVEEVRENFQIDHSKAEDILGKLEKIGVLSKAENGEHKVLMDKEAFLNRIGSYKELIGRMQAVSASQNKNLADITISKKLIVEENEHAVKTRVPGTWGDNAKYLWIEKEKVIEIHNGKTLLTFLDKDREYKLYSADNRVVGTMSGEKMYDRHYDGVGAEVRKRYGEAQSRAAAAAKNVPVPKKR